jgi:hypothetical protein
VALKLSKEKLLSKFGTENEGTQLTTLLLRHMGEWSNIGRRVVSYTLHPFAPENEPLAPAE